MVVAHDEYDVVPPELPHEVEPDVGLVGVWGHGPQKGQVDALRRTRRDQRVGLAHRLLEHLLVALLTQHGANVHQPGLAAATGHGAALQRGEEEHAAEIH
ncbi:hypothetical protein EYF80_051389 [Liparis tanakae]|uniref:Uncharacterized protein n=1 Tax=Liparis tanakae TaxID=230148 RepID=A0A4Z2FCF6_9TELE|nr:hypothetical protein EYF80_051389 [Liparis tanakae]